MPNDAMRKHQVAVSYAMLFAIFALIVALIVSSVAPARLFFFDRLAALRDVYARSSNVIAAVARQAELAEQKPSVPQATYLQGETEALAAADLQNRIKQIVEGEGAVLVSSAFRESGEDLPLTPITVTARMRCSTVALHRILFALESHQPVLFLDRVLIQSRHRPGRPLRDENEELDIDFDVTGYLSGRAGG